MNLSFKPRLALACTLLTPAAYCADAEAAFTNNATLSTEFSAVFYSEAVEIDGWKNDWRGATLSPGEIAFAYSQLKVRQHFKNGLVFGWTRREDYLIEHSKETALFYHRDQNAILDSDNTDYDLFLKAQHLSAYGPTLGLHFKQPDTFAWGFEITHLRATDLIDGVIYGTLTANEDTDITGNAIVDYNYLEDALFDRPVMTDETGRGWTLDLYFHKIWNTQWSSSLQIQDAYSIIHWNNTPYTNAQLTAQNQSLDAGSVTGEPTLQGIESVRKVNQRLPIKSQLESRYQINASNYVDTRWHHYAPKDFFEVAWSNVAWSNVAWSNQTGKRTLTLAAIYPVAALGIHYQRDWFYLGLSFDDIEVTKGHWLSGNAGLKFVF